MTELPSPSQLIEFTTVVKILTAIVVACATMLFVLAIADKVKPVYDDD